MPVTREQKILGGVLALAGLAFGVDRLFLFEATEGVTPVEAHTIAPPVANDAPVVVAMPVASDGGAASSTLDLRFSDIASTLNINPEAVGEAFTSDAAWAELPEVPVTETPVSITEITPEQRIAAFRAEHRLTAVMHTGGADWAVINGDLYAPGRMIGDFQLMEVTSHGAEFRYGDIRFQLTLPGVKNKADNGEPDNGSSLE